MNGLSPSQFTELAPHYDELMQVVPYDHWVEYVLLLCEVADHRPRRVLDCACGTGNLSFELASNGFEVTGVDIAPAMIQVARQKSKHHVYEIDFHEGDLTSFHLDKQFDTATCLYDSLNYILDPLKLEAAFGRIAAHLEPGGYFIFDLNSPYALTEDLFTQYNRDPRKDLHYDWKAKYDPATHVTSVAMQFTRQTPSGVQHFTETHRERAYELEDVEGMLARTGWEPPRIFDAYTLNRPHGKSERWFFLVKKL